MQRSSPSVNPSPPCALNSQDAPFLRQGGTDYSFPPLANSRTAARNSHAQHRPNRECVSQVWPSATFENSNTSWESDWSTPSSTPPVKTEPLPTAGGYYKRGHGPHQSSDWYNSDSSASSSMHSNYGMMPAAPQPHAPPGNAPGFYGNNGYYNNAGYNNPGYNFTAYQQPFPMNSLHVQQSSGPSPYATTSRMNPSTNPLQGAVKQQIPDYQRRVNSQNPRQRPGVIQIKQEPVDDPEAEGDNFSAVFSRSLTSLYSHDPENANAEEWQRPEVQNPAPRFAPIPPSMRNDEPVVFQKLQNSVFYQPSTPNYTDGRNSFGFYDSRNRNSESVGIPKRLDGEEVNSFRYDRPSFDNMHLFTSPSSDPKTQAKKRKVIAPNVTPEGDFNETRKKAPRVSIFKSDSKWTPNSMTYNQVTVKQEPMDEYDDSGLGAPTPAEGPAKDKSSGINGNGGGRAKSSPTPKPPPRKRSPGATCFDRFEKKSTPNNKKVSPLSVYAKVQESVVLSVKCRRYKKRTKPANGKEDAPSCPGKEEMEHYKRNSLTPDQAALQVMGELLERVCLLNERSVMDVPDLTQVNQSKVKELLMQFCHKYGLDYREFDDVSSTFLKPRIVQDKTAKNSERASAIRKRTSTSPDPKSGEPEQVVPPKSDRVRKRAPSARASTPPTPGRRILRSLPGRPDQGRLEENDGVKVEEPAAPVRRYSTRSTRETEEAIRISAIVIDSSTDCESVAGKEAEVPKKSTKKKQQVRKRKHREMPAIDRPTESPIPTPKERRTRSREKKIPNLTNCAEVVAKKKWSRPLRVNSRENMRSNSIEIVDITMSESPSPPDLSNDMFVRELVTPAKVSERINSRNRKQLEEETQQKVVKEEKRRSSSSRKRAPSKQSPPDEVSSSPSRSHNDSKKSPKKKSPARSASASSTTSPTKSPKRKPEPKNISDDAVKATPEKKKKSKDTPSNIKTSTPKPTKTVQPADDVSKNALSSPMSRSPSRKAKRSLSASSEASSTSKISSNSNRQKDDGKCHSKSPKKTDSAEASVEKPVEVAKEDPPLRPPQTSSDKRKSKRPKKTTLSQPHIVYFPFRGIKETPLDDCPPFPNCGSMDRSNKPKRLPTPVASEPSPTPRTLPLKKLPCARNFQSSGPQNSSTPPQNSTFQNPSTSQILSSALQNSATECQVVLPKLSDSQVNSLRGITTASNTPLFESRPTKDVDDSGKKKEGIFSRSKLWRPGTSEEDTHPKSKKEVSVPVSTVRTENASKVSIPSPTVRTDQSPKISVPVSTVRTEQSPKVSAPVSTVRTEQSPKVSVPVSTVRTEQSPKVSVPVPTIRSDQAAKVSAPVSAVETEQSTKVSVPVSTVGTEQTTKVSVSASTIRTERVSKVSISVPSVGSSFRLLTAPDTLNRVLVNATDRSSSFTTTELATVRSYPVNPKVVSGPLYSDADDSVDNNLVIDLDRRTSVEERVPSPAPQNNVATADLREATPKDGSVGGSTARTSASSELRLLDMSSEDTEGASLLLHLSRGGRPPLPMPPSLQPLFRFSFDEEDLNKEPRKKDSILRKLLLDSGVIGPKSAEIYKAKKPNISPKDEEHLKKNILRYMMCQPENGESSCGAAVGGPDDLPSDLNANFLLPEDEDEAEEDGVIDPERDRERIQKLHIEIDYLHYAAEQGVREQRAIHCYLKYKEKVLRSRLKRHNGDNLERVHEWLNSETTSSSPDPRSASEAAASVSAAAPEPAAPREADQPGPSHQVLRLPQQPSARTEAPSATVTRAEALSSPRQGDVLPSVAALVSSASENYGIDMRTVAPAERSGTLLERLMTSSLPARCYSPAAPGPSFSSEPRYGESPFQPYQRPAAIIESALSSPLPDLSLRSAPAPPRSRKQQRHPFGGSNGSTSGGSCSSSQSPPSLQPERSLLSSSNNLFATSSSFVRYLPIVVPAAVPAIKSDSRKFTPSSSPLTGTLASHANPGPSIPAPMDLKVPSRKNQPDDGRASSATRFLPPPPNHLQPQPPKPFSQPHPRSESLDRNGVKSHRKPKERPT